MELEKKFLLREDNEDFATFNLSLPPWHYIEAVSIQQGYLNPDFALEFAYDNLLVDILFPVKEARIRKQERKLTLAFKSDGGLGRHKVEIPIDESTFDTLWKQTEGQRVIKTRQIYTDGKYEIKINYYENLPLIVAEVEFWSEEEANSFKPIGKDVTTDPKYKNRNLVA